MDIESLIRKNIRELKPYSTARDEFQGAAEIYLDANENPYPSAYNRYPDPLQKKVKEKIATIKSVNTERIFLGNGSDEAIDLLIRAFCEPGIDSILIPAPTYGMYSVCAGVNNVAVRTSQLTVDFDLDAEHALSVAHNQVKLIFLCSPNNPSGNLLTKEKVTQVINHFKGIVVIDEAYIDFANDPGFLPELNRYPNLVVMQTLSKAWGLAGLRIGMAFASPVIVQTLNKIKYPYNISTAAQQLVLDKLNVSEKNHHVDQIRTERPKLAEKLNGISCVRHIYPSDANFLLVKTHKSKKVYQYLMSNGIIVRDRSSVILCEDCLRITVGTAPENIRLIEALQTYEA